MIRWSRKTGRTGKALIELLLWAFFGMLAAHPLAAADFSLFGDLTFADSNASDSPSSFALGALDLYGTHQINDQLTGFVELVAAAEDDGEFEIDVERLWIRYEFSSAFQIAAGRFHTPIGSWNRTYHHGTLIQDTVGRPFFLEFEDHGGFLPTHVIGLMATGETWTGLGTLRYELAVGNGPELSSEAGLDPQDGERPKLDPNAIQDQNNDKSLSGRLSLRGDRGWQVGIFGLTQAVPETGSPDRGALVGTGETLVDQTILGLDLGYKTNRFGLMGEFFHITNDFAIAPGSKFSATAFYAQGWVDLRESWRLTYRFSSLNLNTSDPFFRLLAVQEQAHHVLTLGYRMDEASVIKFEVDRLQSDALGLDEATILKAQWAFLIP